MPSSLSRLFSGARRSTRRTAALTAVETSRLKADVRSLIYVYEWRFLEIWARISRMTASTYAIPMLILNHIEDGLALIHDRLGVSDGIGFWLSWRVGA